MSADCSISPDSRRSAARGRLVRAGVPARRLSWASSTPGWANSRARSLQPAGQFRDGLLPGVGPRRAHVAEVVDDQQPRRHCPRGPCRAAGRGCARLTPAWCHRRTARSSAAGPAPGGSGPTRSRSPDGGRCGAAAPSPRRRCAAGSAASRSSPGWRTARAARDGCRRARRIPRRAGVLPDARPGADRRAVPRAAVPRSRNRGRGSRSVVPGSLLVLERAEHFHDGLGVAAAARQCGGQRGRVIDELADLVQVQCRARNRAPWRGAGRREAMP